MNIREISVTKLFGYLNHTITLKEDRITIIHGPNGIGKTVLLRMVDGLFNGNFLVFNSIPFEKFIVEFTNNQTITLVKDRNNELPMGKLLLYFPDMSSEPINIGLKNLRREIDFPLAAIEEFIPWLDRIGPELWRDTKTSELLTLDEIINNFYDRLPANFQISIPPLKKIYKLINTHFIKTDRLRAQDKHLTDHESRLYRRNLKEDQGSAVSQYSQELSSRIQQALAKYAEISSSLDRTFPSRLVNQRIRSQAKSKATDEAIRSELTKLEDKRTRLMNVGLLDKDEKDIQLPSGPVDDMTRLVLWIYVKDVQEKLKIFDEDLAKAELFQQIISRRFSNKKFRIEKEKGIVFTAYNNETLPLNALSSGEQHEIILLYELLYNVKPNSLILIDEPEISLHITWQQEFLKDLLAITNLSKFEVLIATHSPDIINDRWDLTISLDDIQKQ